jgi:hypothetical protein
MALVVMMAVVAIAIPTCTMIGCEMGMSGGMPYMPSGTGIFNSCAGEWVTNTGPAGVLPSGLENIVLVLGAIIVAVAITLAPHESHSMVRILAAEPPPPPEDPLGQRTRI